MLLVLLLVVRSLVAGVGSRRDLMLENLALRHQLQVALRTNPHPRLRPRDRALWVWLHGVWPDGWRQHLRLVRPETVLRWHRKGWRLLLVLEVARQARPASPECRGQGADRPDVEGESALGQRAHSWRTAEARHRRQQPLHPPEGRQKSIQFGEARS